MSHELPITGSTVTSEPGYGPFSSADLGQDLSGSLQGAGGVGGLLIVSLNGTNVFPCFDGNGNVMSLVTASDGTLVAEYEYGPFGETLKANGALADANTFRFSTKAQDESGLLYYGYRYYSPSLGRWLSMDPAGEFLSGPDYLFAENCPVTRVDALGLSSATYPQPPELRACKWEGVALVSAPGGSEENYGYCRSTLDVEGVVWPRIPCCTETIKEGVKFDPHVSCTVGIEIRPGLDPNEKTDNSVIYTLWQHESIHAANREQQAQKLLALFQWSRKCVPIECNNERQDFVIASELVVDTYFGYREYKLHADDTADEISQPQWAEAAQRSRQRYDALLSAAQAKKVALEQCLRRAQ